MDVVTSLIQLNAVFQGGSKARIMCFRVLAKIFSRNLISYPIAITSIGFFSFCFYCSLFSCSDLLKKWRARAAVRWAEILSEFEMRLEKVSGKEESKWSEGSMNAGLKERYFCSIEVGLCEKTGGVGVDRGAAQGSRGRGMDSLSKIRMQQARALLFFFIF